MICRRTMTLAVLCAPLALTFTARQALANTVSLYTIDHSQSESFTAGNGAGDYVINDSLSTACGGPWGSPCYKVGNVTTPGWSFATTPPHLSPSGSTPSTPALPKTGGDWTVFSTLGFLVSAEYDDGKHDIRGIFDGSDPFTDFVGKGSIDGGIDAGSAVFFIDGADGTLAAAIDKPSAVTPEPATLALLGSGLSGIAPLLRRRLKAR